MKNREQGKNSKLWIGLLILLTILVLGYNIYKGAIKNKIDMSINLLNDPSEFYTVSSAAAKYTNYLYDADSKKIYILLDNEYKKDKLVTEDNVLDMLGKIEAKNFNAFKIYKQQVGNSIYKYYIKGYIEQEIMDSLPKRTEYYLIIIMDTNNLTFSVIPYNKSDFEGLKK